MRQIGGVVDAGQLVNAAQQIDRVDRTVFDFLALGIRLAHDLAALETAARHQHRIDFAVVVASAVPRRLPIDLRAAAELAAAPDQRAFQQASVVQVRQQGRQALIELRALAAHGREVVAVRIPAAGVIDDHVGHARLDQPSRDQAFLPERVPPVAVAQLRLLLVQIEHFLARPQDQLVGIRLGFLGQNQLGAGRHHVAHRVHLDQQVAPRLLSFVGDAASDHPLDLEPRRIGIASGRERLEARPEKTFLGEPPLRPRQHDVGRNQAFVVGALEIGEHGADARKGQSPAGRMTGLHQVGGRFVPVVAVGHAADDRELVRGFRQLGKQRSEADAGHVGVRHIAEFAHVILARFGLRIPRVVVRHAAPQEDLDHRLGSDFGLRLFRFRGSRQGTGGDAVAHHQATRTKQAPAHGVAPGHVHRMVGTVV